MKKSEKTKPKSIWGRLLGIGDSLTSVFLTTEDSDDFVEIPAVNPISTKPPRSQPKSLPKSLPKPNAFEYSVVQGDTVEGLAIRFGITTYQLRRINGIFGQGQVIPGQTLKIPCQIAPKEKHPNLLRCHALPKFRSCSMGELKPSVNLKEHCILCMDNLYISGLLSVSVHFLSFDPSTAEEIVKTRGSSTFRIFLPMAIISSPYILPISLTLAPSLAAQPVVKDETQSPEHKQENVTHDSVCGTHELLGISAVLNGEEIQHTFFIPSGNQRVIHDHIQRWLADLAIKRTECVVGSLSTNAIPNPEHMIFSNLPPLATRNHAGSNHQIKPEKTEFVDDPNSSSNHKDKDEVKPKSSRQVEDIEKDIEILNRELGPPILIGGPSGILTESQFQLLRRELPQWLQANEWTLLYSLNDHGMCLDTLYSRVSVHSYTVIVVLTNRGEVLGGFASDAWSIGSEYYGTGNSFLFKFSHPTFAPSSSPRIELKAFHWTGKNSFVMLATSQGMAMGGGGDFGLFIDSNLNQGYSDHCDTFENECLCDNGKHFICVALEVWSLDTLL